MAGTTSVTPPPKRIGPLPGSLPSGMAELELLAVSIGNTRTRVGAFRGRALEHSTVLQNGDPALAQAVLDSPIAPTAPVVVASVNPPVAEPLLAELQLQVRQRGGDLYIFGRDLAIPFPTALDNDSSLGHDRLLNALGAYARARQACIIVDAGTAITVDFVDGEGVFQGGAIGPGLNMMLEALHEKTAALPSLRFEPVGDDQPFGKQTHQAMLLGVQAAARGMVRHLIERYSEAYGAYPQIVATGGDARTLFENDDLVEAIVPDLTLIGMQAACALQLAADTDDDDE
jgi:type III pantothenate kinase